MRWRRRRLSSLSLSYTQTLSFFLSFSLTPCLSVPLSLYSFHFKKVVRSKRSWRRKKSTKLMKRQTAFFQFKRITFLQRTYLWGGSRNGCYSYLQGLEYFIYKTQIKVNTFSPETKPQLRINTEVPSANWDSVKWQILAQKWRSKVAQTVTICPNWSHWWNDRSKIDEIQLKSHKSISQNLFRVPQCHQTVRIPMCSKMFFVFNLACV